MMTMSSSLPLNGAQFSTDIEQRVHTVKLGLDYRCGTAPVDEAPKCAKPAQLVMAARIPASELT